MPESQQVPDPNFLWDGDWRYAALSKAEPDSIAKPLIKEVAVKLRDDRAKDDPMLAETLKNLTMLAKRTFRDNSGKFTIIEVSKLLSHLNEQEIDTLAPENKRFITSTINTANRHQTTLADSKQEYQGKWHFQGIHGTCVAWSLAHGLMHQGSKIDPNLMTVLLNLATRNGSEDFKEHGLSFTQTAGIVNTAKRSNVELRVIDTALNSTRKLSQEDNLLRASIPQETYNLIQTLSNSGAFQLPSKLRNLYSQNAQAIKESLDQGKCLMISTSPSYLMTGKENSNNYLHAVLIGGYRINQGVMDVQIIDSANGVYWTSLEHLSSSLEENSTSYAISEKIYVADDNLCMLSDDIPFGLQKMKIFRRHELVANSAGDRKILLT